MTDMADDILIHFGKKGMKWGVRNERRGEATKAPKPTTREIKDARALYNQRVNQVNKEHVMLRYAASPKARRIIESEIDKHNRELLNDPRTAIAGKKTRGEKFVGGAILVTLGSLAASQMIRAYG